MKLSKSLFATLIIAGLTSTAATAQSTQVTVSSDDRVVVSVQVNNTFLTGNKHFSSSNGTLLIDGLVPSEAGNGSGTPCSNNCTQENEGGTGDPQPHELITDWGEADVILGCYEAAVILFEHTAAGNQLVLDEVVNTDYCAQ